MHHGAVERNVHQVGFRSSAFPRDPLEDDELGGVHGMALAFWAAEALVAAGLEVGEPFPEDHGWMLDVRGPGRVVVTCSAIPLTVDEHGIVVEDVPRRFRKADPAGAELVARTVAVLAAALDAHPDITEVAWVQGGLAGGAG